MEKSATLDLIKKNIVLHSFSSDEANGIRKATAPFYKLPIVFNGELVSAIKDVLANSKEKVHFDAQYSPSKAIKEATGLTFTKMHAAKNKSISLSQEGKTITFLPTKIIGANKGFTHLNDKKVYISVNATDKEILQALEEALSYCE